MGQVADQFASVRVVAHVLNDGAAVGVCVRLTQLFMGGIRESLQKRWPNMSIPRGVDDGFVS